MLWCVKKCKIENSKSVTKICPCNENSTKCHENVMFLKRHGLWRKKVFYAVSSEFCVSISESVHPIFTWLQTNENTRFSASIGTNLDKIGKRALAHTSTSSSDDTNSKQYQLKSEKIASVIKWEIAQVTKWEITQVTKWENSTDYKVGREYIYMQDMKTCETCYILQMKK